MWSLCASLVFVALATVGHAQTYNGTTLVNTVVAAGGSKVLCHYNSTSFHRRGLAKMTFAELEPALSFCTHLIYGPAGIQADTHKIATLDPTVEVDQGHYRIVTQLKRKFPGLKVILSVGTGSDAFDANGVNKYLTLLESSGARLAFVNSAYSLVKTYEFDGIDLAWPFPADRPKKIKSGFKKFWASVKSTVGISKGPIDEKADEHKEEFVALVRELRQAFEPDHLAVFLTVNPNVNLGMFYDIPSLVGNVDLVTLSTYDFQTPERNPKEADYPAPIYQPTDRLQVANVQYQVTSAITARLPANKLIVAIPTHGRSWKLETDATITGVPPILGITTAGAAGPHTATDGLLSYPELCAKLPNPSNRNLQGEQAPLRKVGDPSHRHGAYAYRLPDGDGNYGLWVGYEDPDAAGTKAAYVKTYGLAGIAVMDLAYDDFRGACTGDKFPILRAAKYRL